MKKTNVNDNIDIIELKETRKDIVKIISIYDATLKDKKSGETYLNGTFLKIIDRKGKIRVLDLLQGIDITGLLKKLDIIYSKKTVERVIFEEK